VKRSWTSFLFLFLLPSLILNAPSQPKSAGRASANDILRQYVEARLRWAHWKDYSRLITWPDEPGWDCWWVAKDYRIGEATHGVATSVIPVTYRRLGLFCADFELQPKPKTETIDYKLVRKGDGWKVNGPTPDYPYISVQALDEYLTRTISDPSEQADRKTQARHALEALRVAKLP
jgi:hypothetical protein